MNKIFTVPTTNGELSYFEVEVDGVLLANHFAGRLGAHPSQLSPLGWSTASDVVRADIAAEFLAEKPSSLESGRVPVLVCEECGDVGCGAFAVRIIREGERIIWLDWRYENGYAPPSELEWPTQPGDFIFELSAKPIGSDSLLSHKLSH